MIFFFLRIIKVLTSINMITTIPSITTITTIIMITITPIITITTIPITRMATIMIMMKNSNVITGMLLQPVGNVTTMTTVAITVTKRTVQQLHVMDFNAIMEIVLQPAGNVTTMMTKAIYYKYIMAFKAQEDHKGEHPGLHISQLDTELLAAEVVAIVHPKQSRQSLAKTHSNVRACCYCTAAPPSVARARTHGRRRGHRPRCPLSS